MKNIALAINLIIVVAWVMCLLAVIISLVQAEFLKALGCFLALLVVSKIRVKYEGKDGN